MAARFFSHNIGAALLGVVLPVSGLAYYVHTKTLSPVPLTKRQRHLITTLEYEKKVGNMIYNQMMKGSNAPTVLHTNHPASKTVRSIGERLAKHTPSSVGGPSRWDFVAVSDKKNPNAFATPPNHCVIYSGLFKYSR